MKVWDRVRVELATPGSADYSAEDGVKDISVDAVVHSGEKPHATKESVLRFNNSNNYGTLPCYLDHHRAINDTS